MSGRTPIIENDLGGVIRDDNATNNGGGSCLPCDSVLNHGQKQAKVNTVGSQHIYFVNAKVKSKNEKLLYFKIYLQILNVLNFKLSERSERLTP